VLLSADGSEKLIGPASKASIADELMDALASQINERKAIAS
jgi:hypothetical protein